MVEKLLNVSENEKKNQIGNIHQVQNGNVSIRTILLKYLIN